MFAIAAARSSPMASAFVSSSRLDEGEDGVSGGAGDGEALDSVVLIVVGGSWAGAAGVMVSRATGAGVEGAGAVALLLDAPGCGFGWRPSQYFIIKRCASSQSTF
jgi:hypothetical protein